MAPSPGGGKVTTTTHPKVLDLIQSGPRPLHQAALDGQEDFVELLLKNGASINSQDDQQGNTALHEACWRGFSRTVNILTKYKANPYIKNKGGFTPLHLACQQGHNESTRILLISGCKPDLKNNYGDTPLHTAARYGHAGVARILISALCNVSQANKNGDTPLHITAAMGRRKLTRILLESGCNATIKNKQGETAMDIALRKSFVEVQELIANPPPSPSLSPPPPTKSSNGCSKQQVVKGKRDKTTFSLGSGSRTSNEKALKKKGKHHGSSKSVQFVGLQQQPVHSPYGCPLSPDPSEFPKPNLDSLPSDPLRAGEQYFVDLAGNIKKGPVPQASRCHCKPPTTLNAQTKQDQDFKHQFSDCHHGADLDAKICSLEQLTMQNQKYKLFGKPKK